MIMGRLIISRCITILLFIHMALFCYAAVPVYGAAETVTAASKVTYINPGGVTAHRWDFGVSKNKVLERADISAAGPDQTRKAGYDQLSQGMSIEGDGRRSEADSASESQEAEDGFSAVQLLVLLAAVVGGPVFLIIRMKNKNKDVKEMSKNQTFKVPGREVQEIPVQANTREMEPAAQKWTLTGVDGIYAGKKIMISQSLRFGRSFSKSNVLYPNGIGVSNNHCEVVLRNNRPYIQDLLSTYGTYVNGERLTPQMLIPLNEDDEIYLGNENQRFRVGIMP